AEASCESGELIEIFDVPLKEDEPARTHGFDQCPRFVVGRRSLKSEKKKLPHHFFQGETSDLFHSAFFFSSANILNASRGVRLSISIERREFRSSSSSAVKSANWFTTTLCFRLARDVRLSDNSCSFSSCFLRISRAR